jgi:hypothetical protein
MPATSQADLISAAVRSTVRPLTSTTVLRHSASSASAFAVRRRAALLVRV